MNPAKFAGLVLAGGQSSRMGTDKSSLVFQNKTFLEHACSCLKKAAIDIIVVSGQHSGYVCIHDRWLQAGPAGAILSAAFQPCFQSIDYLLVLPVDMPLLSSIYLTVLRETMENEWIESCFFRKNPLPCCIKLSALQRIASAYNHQPNSSMLTLLTEKLNHQILDFNEEMEENLININTADAFSKLRREYET